MNLHAISLGNHEFEGENNAYLLESAGEVALIDTGIPRPAIRTQLEAGLDAAGRTLADVDAVVLTHHHLDHAGLAGAVADAGGADVFVHETDAPLVRRDDDAVATEYALRARRFDEWGMPADQRSALQAFFDRAPTAEPPARVVELVDGDEIDVGDATLRTRFAPGHTAGHAIYEFDRAGATEALVGDVVLPTYTPNVGGADLRLDRPLTRYVETLTAVVERDYERVWPGHRDVIDGPAARAREILAHHRDRLENVLDVLEPDETHTAWEISAELFGELDRVHILHGPGEAHSHVEYLVDRGAAERVADEESGRIGYLRADESIDAAPFEPAVSD
ncbi:MBL fold metallo-hydrolase [Halovivax limisalsi]|uniref:MBL fold metallo-hydrolase n=1 Tax=Halovivax limisalsi TaxID=1453760 RepID=UPI001FFD4459|nr:MBL fold metallo-hydrolase [Halovivax limisalsi]